MRRAPEVEDDENVKAPKQSKKLTKPDEEVRVISHAKFIASTNPLKQEILERRRKRKMEEETRKEEAQALRAVKTKVAETEESKLLDDGGTMKRQGETNEKGGEKKHKLSSTMARISFREELEATINEEWNLAKRRRTSKDVQQQIDTNSKVQKCGVEFKVQGDGFEHTPMPFWRIAKVQY